jgi:hypothetical protein
MCRRTRKWERMSGTAERPSRPGGSAALDDGVEADLLGVGDPGPEGVERLPLVEVGRGDPVTAGTKLVGKAEYPRREPLGVMEQHDVGQVLFSFASGSVSRCASRRSRGYPRSRRQV